MIAKRFKASAVFGVLFAPFLLAGCSQTTSHGMSLSSVSVSSLTDAITPSFLSARPLRSTPAEKECLERAMFFESNRSSRDGMIAVGTVVMNRLKSGDHGNTICQVVGAPGQFAPGVMTRKMNSKAMPDVEEAATAVLKGERSPKLRNAMYFHTAGLKFPYKNMHYVLVAGGNAFYEKRGRNFRELPPDSAFAYNGGTPDAQPAVPGVMVASAATLPGVQDNGIAVDAQPQPELPTAVALVLPQTKPGHRVSGDAVVAAPQPAIAVADASEQAIQPQQPASKKRRKPVAGDVYVTASADQPAKKAKPVIGLDNAPVPTARAALIPGLKSARETRRSITEVAAEMAAEEPNAARFGRSDTDSGEPTLSFNGQ